MVVFILNFEFNESENIYYSLSNFYGISYTSIRKIYKNLGLNFRYNWFYKDLNNNQLKILKNFLKDNFIFESELKKKIKKNLMKIDNVNCYKRMRLRLSLPVNGQRTHTNAKTSRNFNYKILKKNK